MRKPSGRLSGLLCLVISLAAATAAHAAVFVFDTPISGDVVEVTLSVENVAPDTVSFTVSIPPGEGDILGLFGNVVDESLVPDLTVVDPDAIVTQWQFQANAVWKVGAGNSMAPVKTWDWGVKLGATGSAGEVLESASFQLTAPGLDAGQILDAATQGWVLGVRIQTTLGPEGSSKLGLAEGTPPVGGAPEIAITSPADGTLTTEATVTVTGTVSSTTPVTVEVNGIPATVMLDAWTAEVPLALGANPITATATNDAGSDTDSITVIRGDAPVVTITAPAAGFLTNQSLLLVTGDVTGTPPVTLTVNGAPVTPSGGSFSTTLTLVEGPNLIEAVATNDFGSGSASVIATLDTTPPAVSFAFPPDNTATANPEVPLSGSVVDASPIASFDVNGVSEELTDGFFLHIGALALGPNLFTATATDAAGNTGSAQLTVIRGAVPTATIQSPADGGLFGSPAITVSGTLAGDLPITVDVNGVAATVVGTSFTVSLTLVEGLNPIVATATNLFGTGTAQIEVALDTTPPDVHIVVPADGASFDVATTQVAGEIFDASPIVGLTLNGAPLPPGSTFGEVISLLEGPNPITVEATDAVGNVGSDMVSVTRNPLPPLTIEILEPFDGFDTADPEQTVTGTVSDADATVDVNGFPAAVNPSGAWVATLPVALGGNLLTATAQRGVETANDSVNVFRFEIDNLLRFRLIDDERSPKEGFGAHADALIAYDEVDFRSYLDGFGTPAADFVPRPGYIEISGETENIHLAVFTDFEDAVGEFMRLVLTTPEAVVGNGNTRTFLPIEDLANELLVQGLDPALAPSLLPTDITATAFMIFEVDLCSDGGGDFGYGYDEGDGGQPGTCLNGLIHAGVGRFSFDGDWIGFVVDEVAPSASFTFPPSGAVVGGDRITVMGEVADFFSADPFDLDAGGPLFQQVNYQVFDESSGTPVLMDSGSAPIVNGDFTLIDLPVGGGAQRVRVALMDAAGNAGTADLPFVVDPNGAVGNIGPTITTAPLTGAAQDQLYSYDVEAEDADGDLLTFSLFEAPVGMTITPVSGVIQWTPTFDQAGSSYPVTVRVDDTGNLSSSQSFEISVTNVNDPPFFTSTPVVGAREAELYSYIATADDLDLFLGDTLTFLPESVPVGMDVDPDTGEVTWVPGMEHVGEVPVSLRVEDAAGDFDIQSFTVTVLARPRATIDSPADGSLLLTGTVTVTGTVNNPAATVTVNGVVATVVGNDYTATITLAPGSNLIEVVVTDGGATTTAQNTVLYDDAPPVNIPPDPSTVAPPLDQTVATTTFAATEFLYDGTSGIQTGVDPGTIDPVRAAVLRGRVKTRDEMPVEGVTVTVLDHPEFGQTVTRSDGMFDLVTNGGGVLTLRFERFGFVPAQRTVEAPAQDFRFLDDVVIVPLDGRVTTIDLATLTDVVVHQGSLEADEDGERQATLMFKPGTAATLEFPDGTTQPISSISVRATEFTVGPNGPEAMPAILPPSSAYTYAVELSVDEALAAGASGVNFSQPVAFYVDNFLGFPTGERVPVGFYDRERGVWVPSDDGAVVEILAENAGLAEVDVDGDGLADTLPVVELAELAALYEPGDSLWRVEIPHFSTWDCNWPYRLPPDAVGWPGFVEPSETEVEVIEETEEEQEPETEICGNSMVGIENQVYREQVAVAGADFNLSYSSTRAPGRVANRSAKVNVTGDGVPSSLQEVRLEFEIAGQRQNVTLPPDALQDYRFTWDQKDAYGRDVQGAQPLTARVEYVYQPDYSQPPAWNRGFAGFGGATLVGIPSRGEALAVTTERTAIGVFDPKGLGLGGWNISEHHAYDPVAQEIHLGNGRKRSAVGIAPGVTTVAGVQGEPGHDGNGGAATAAHLNAPVDVAVAPDGSIYVVAGAYSSTEGHVRRIRTDGTIETVVGSNGASGPCPTSETCPAIITSLDRPRGIAFGPDGSYYIAETGAGRIRRVKDAMISTVAGTGTPGFPTLGSSALGNPLAAPRDVAVAPDGAIYILDVSAESFGDNRVLRIGTDGVLEEVYSGANAPCPDSNTAFVNRNFALAPNGDLFVPQGCRVIRISTGGNGGIVAGDGFLLPPSPPFISLSFDLSHWGYAGDGQPATAPEVQIDAHTIAVGPDGSLFLADSGLEEITGFGLGSGIGELCNGCVRRVAPDRVITTFAGGPEFDPLAAEIPEGTPPLQAAFQAAVVPAVGPSGVLYLADPASHVVRKVEAKLPGYSATDIVIPSEDGREFYVFDEVGRHLSTVEARTNVVLRTFQYDPNGRLVSMTDRHGRVTQINRGLGGQVTSIQAPFGKTTTLGYDGDDQLTSIQNPAGDTYSLGYDGASGLLTSFQRPTLGTTLLEYDELGRLTRDEGPSGNVVQLERTQGRGEFSVEATDTLGRKGSYSLQNRTTGETARALVSRAGDVREVDQQKNAERSNVLRDGSELFQESAPDPRFGMLSAVPERTELALPSGLTQVIQVERSQTFLVPGLPASGVASQTDTLSVNGRSLVRSFDVASRVGLTITAAGRAQHELFDSQGRIIESRVEGLDPVSFGYDSQGRLANISQGQGVAERLTTLSYDADGNLQTVTDPLMQSIDLVFDPVGRVTQQTLPDGRVVDYTYDGNGNLTSVTPPGQPAHVFRYAPDDLEVEYEPPAVIASDPRTFFTYDADRNLIQVDRPDGKSIVLSYDVGSRLSTVTTPRGLTSRSYDPLTGNLSSIVAPGGEALSFTYDGSRLLETIWSGTVNGSVSQDHDTDFRIVSQSVNGAQAQSFAYDDDGLLVQAGAMTLSRDPLNGLLTGTALGQVSTTQSYNAFGEVSSDSAIVGASVLYANAYTRDKLGRITQKVETIQGGTTTTEYDYDLAGRLVSVSTNGALARTYSYDSNGNRLSLTDGATVTSGSYDAQDRLTGYGDFTYSYNENGDLESKTEAVTGATTLYSYDAVGNLIQVALPDGTLVEYVIDGQDRRVGKKVNGVLVQGWLYQGQLNPVAEIDGAGNLTARFVYGSKSNVPDYMLKGGTSYRIISDHLGSPRLVVDTATGAIAQSIRYDEFGIVVEDTNPGFQPFGFAGGHYDAMTGLVRFGVRDYDASVGRWTVKDPARFDGGTNLYGYISSDPINWIDPFGLYGTGSCSYYNDRCDESGGNYYCHIAPFFCRLFPDFESEDPDPSRDDDFEGWSRCTRQCLQDCDRSQNSGQNSCPDQPDPATDEFFDPGPSECHVSCYVTCYGNKLLGSEF